MKLLNSFLQFIFPENCKVCKKSGTLLCPKCLDGLELVSSSRMSKLPNYINPIFEYKDSVVQDLIWKFKYSGATSVADIFVVSLHDTVSGLTNDLFETSGAKGVLLIPIPITQSRARARGYNQSRLLVESVSAQGPVGRNTLYYPVYDVLKKKTSSTSQTKSHSRVDRLANIKGSFFVTDASMIKGKHIILIDDVVTTGATLGEARKTLLAAGARSVQAVTIAH